MIYISFGTFDLQRDETLLSIIKMDSKIAYYVIPFFSDLIHNFVSSHCFLFCSLIVFSSLSLFFSLQVDKLVLGGGMVFTFLKARGVNVGNSLVEDDQVWKSVCLSVLLYQFCFSAFLVGSLTNR